MQAGGPLLPAFRRFLRRDVRIFRDKARPRRARGLSSLDRRFVEYARRSIYSRHSSRSIVKITAEGWRSIGAARRGAARRVRAARSREKGLCRDNPKRGRDDAWLLPIYAYLCPSRGIPKLNGDR